MQVKQKEVPEQAHRASKDDEIDLIELLLYFWNQRFTILKVVGAFFLLGALVVLLSRVEYEASTTLMPESQSPQSSASSLLRQYGGMLGIQGGGQMGSEGISTSRYPDIIASTPYQVELMNESVQFSSLDTTLTPHEYFRDIYPPSTMDYIKRYTIGLPGQLMSLLKGSNTEIETEKIVTEIARDSVMSLNGQQRSTIGKLKERISITNEGGLITLSAEFPDPRAAAEIGNKATSLLKQYVREYRTQKANDELEFARKQVNAAKKRFEEAQMKLAEFRDRNVNLATAKAQTREQELQSQYDLTFDLYNSLTQNLEQAKLKVQENTPVFSVIEPIQVPTNNSKPNTKLILALFVFMGLILGFVWIAGKKVWRKISIYYIED